MLKLILASSLGLLSINLFAGGGTIIVGMTEMEKALESYDLSSSVKIDEKALTPLQPFTLPDGRNGLVTMENGTGSIFTMIEKRDNPISKPTN